MKPRFEILGDLRGTLETVVTLSLRDGGRGGLLADSPCPCRSARCIASGFWGGGSRLSAGGRPTRAAGRWPARANSGTWLAWSSRTNTLENLNREFRRRTTTQASFGTEDAALTVLYGLVAFGQIVLRKIDGAQQQPSFLAKEWQKVA